jgi:hypothetical protein
MADLLLALQRKAAEIWPRCIATGPSDKAIAMRKCDMESIASLAFRLEAMRALYFYELMWRQV